MRRALPALAWLVACAPTGTLDVVDGVPSHEVVVPRIELDDPGVQQTCLQDSEVEIRSYNPCVIDPAVRNLCGPSDTLERGLRLHRVVTPVDGARTDTLVVFLQGSNLAPGEGMYPLELAALAGHRAIGLGYDNTTVVKDTCAVHAPGDTACHGAIRHEVLYGEDRSDLLTVGPPDSIIGRLVSLLRRLHRDEPDGGWDRYLATGEPAWADLRLLGFSQGSGHGALLSMDHELAGVVLLAGATDHIVADGGERVLADWLTSDGRATPADRLAGLFHRSQDPDGSGLETAWTALGIDAPAVSVDGALPPYDGARRLVTEVEPPDGCTDHRILGEDVCRVPELDAPLAHLLCTTGAR